MRYTVGEKIPFIFLEVDHKGKPPFFGPRYIPWEHELTGVTIRYLTCKEHHKVPNEWDEKQIKSDDGFIFEDEEGQRWLNQYPQSHYGQLDNTNDTRVFKDHGGGSHSGYFGVWMEHGLACLENIWRGVYQFRNAENIRREDPKADEHAQMLEDYYHDLKKRIEDHCKIKLDIKNASFTNKEGVEKVLDDHFDVFVVQQ